MAKKDGDVSVIESGNIYFVYRPKVGTESADGRDDIQRFHIVLKPKGKKQYRLLTIGQKRMPDVNKHGQQTWGFVDGVKNDSKKLEESMREQHYQTKTRGERTVPAARPAGEGTYELVNHGSHVHLVYALELPDKTGDVQQDLDIEPEASYILQIKNPEQGAPKGAGLSEQQKANLPKELQQRFDGRRFISADPTEFLEHEGVEILLIAASDNISAELGVELEADNETESTADMIRDLHMRKSRHPIEPLLKGEWR